MFIPLRTTRRPKRPPRVTELLILANCLVYLGGQVSEALGGITHLDLMLRLALNAYDFEVWQLFTYQFAHASGSLWHIGFNMLFLWVFGAAVEGRLGRIGYIVFYLLSGAVAGGAQALLDPGLIIGASGSVAAVTGAFLALFPRASVVVLVFLFMIGVTTIPALWLVSLFIIVDILNQAFGDSRVGHWAHLAGYVTGFGTGFVLLATRIIPRDEFDAFYLWKQYRRRSTFRRLSQAGPGGMYESASADTGRQLQLDRERERAREEPPVDPNLVQARTEICTLVREHDLPRAAARLQEAQQQHGEVALPEEPLIDIAAYLHASGDVTAAATLYEQFTDRFPKSRRADEVRLLLATLCQRQLGRAGDVKGILDALSSRLPDDQAALADALRREAEASS